jgi:hypothetical protein
LLGYDEPQIKDNQLYMTLYWQTLTEPLPDYVRFVHVVANGSLQTQADSRPVHNRYPTRLWQTGEYVIDPITITLPGPLPPDYVLHVGFYDPATVTRLPTTLATPDYVLIAPP